MIDHRNAPTGGTATIGHNRGRRSRANNREVVLFRHRIDRRSAAHRMALT